MPEFFLELFSEEIPARMQALAHQELRRICEAAFKELSSQDFFYYVGPRRIAVHGNIHAEKPGGVTEARGPRESAPDTALAGFLSKYDAQRNEVVTEGGYFWLRRAEQPVTAATIINTVLASALAKFSWPKSMRWGQSGDFTWVRPLRRIVCLLDGQIIPIKVGPVTASNETEGHRILCPGPVIVSSAKEWYDVLLKRKVNANQDDRRRDIENGLKSQAELFGLNVVKDDALLDEVTGLVEWPVALVGKIDAEFMDLPPEVRELSMKVNQRYFALRDGKGNPAPNFAFVSNIETEDDGATIIAGNERVLRARLSDARHFWDLDIRLSYTELLRKLENITFHSKIGTQRNRAEEIRRLAGQIARIIQPTENDFEIAQAEHAGQLCKADLVTGMVGEFPELQGIIGGYYAEKSWGLPGDQIGLAIKTHYQPKGPHDAVPKGIVPISVALADKLYTLVQFFAVGEKPTGSGDPYALRRAALGVIRIILENNLSLPLLHLIGGDRELFDFIIERLRIKLRSEGRRFDILDAILGAATDDDLVRLMERVNAVTEFLATADGANLLTAYRRAANILRIEDAKDGPHLADDLHRNFGSAEADDLRDALTGADVAADYNAGNYTPVMEYLARLRAPVDAFFDKVTVNAPEPELRRNRLQLLAKLRDTMHLIADFSKIEG